MSDYGYITTASAGRNKVRITVDAKQGNQSRVQIGITYDQDDAANLVRNICRDAGLPEPWEA